MGGWSRTGPNRLRSRPWGRLGCSDGRCVRLLKWVGNGGNLARSSRLRFRVYRSALGGGWVGSMMPGSHDSPGTELQPAVGSTVAPPV